MNLYSQSCYFYFYFFKLQIWFCLWTLYFKVFLNKAKSATPPPHTNLTMRKCNAESQKKKTIVLCWSVFLLVYDPPQHIIWLWLWFECIHCSTVHTLYCKQMFVCCMVTLDLTWVRVLSPNMDVRVRYFNRNFIVKSFFVTTLQRHWKIKLSPI